MAVTPTGALSVPIDYLRQLVAASATFRTWTNQATEALAKNRVYAPAKPKIINGQPSGIVWPHAVCGFHDGGWSIGGRMGEYVAGGSTLFLYFEAKIPISSEPDETYTFTNQVGAIVNEMWVASRDGTADRLDVNRITKTQGPQWASESLQAGEANSQQGIMVVHFDVSYGEA